MKDTDDRGTASLPVTAEVGGEGGNRSESVSANAADDVRRGVVKHPSQ